jgi:hypothetical protein
VRDITHAKPLRLPQRRPDDTPVITWFAPASPPDGPHIEKFLPGPAAGEPLRVLGHTRLLISRSRTSHYANRDDAEAGRRRNPQMRGVPDKTNRTHADFPHSRFTCEAMHDYATVQTHAHRLPCTDTRVLLGQTHFAIFEVSDCALLACPDSGSYSAGESVYQELGQDFGWMEGACAEFVGG